MAIPHLYLPLGLVARAVRRSLLLDQPPSHIIMEPVAQRRERKPPHARWRGVTERERWTSSRR